MTALSTSLLSGCVSESPSGDLLEAEMKCGMPRSELSNIAIQMNARVVENDQYTQITVGASRPAKFIVFFENERVFGVDRESVEHYLVGSPASYGFHAALNCESDR